MTVGELLAALEGVDDEMNIIVTTGTLYATPLNATVQTVGYGTGPEFPATSTRDEFVIEVAL